MQHPTLWGEYSSLPIQQRKHFFSAATPVKSHHRELRKSVADIYLINVPIINVVIGQMLRDPHDVEGETHSKMLTAFEDCLDASENPASEAAHLTGCSFPQTALLFNSTHEISADAGSEPTVANYAQINPPRGSPHSHPQ
eukprot:Sdes_comp21533_c0_seq1m20143